MTSVCVKGCKQLESVIKAAAEEHQTAAAASLIFSRDVWEASTKLLLGPLLSSSSLAPMSQVELDQEKGLEMRRWVLSGILTSEETYLNHLEALLIVGVSFGSV